MIYKINNYDITPFVIGQNKIKYNSGRRTNFAANNGSIQVVNDSFLFSPENAESIFYDYRNDYSKFVVTIENNGQTFWRGIIDNINRDPSSKTVEIETTEFIIALLDIKSFEYKSGDGYTGNKAYAGNATAAAHQLALLRRFLSEDCIDETSFLAAKELQAANSILCDCEISDTDIITPIDFLKSLCLDITRLTIYNNKVFLETNKIFKGKFGYLLNDNVIININRIIRVLTKDTYSRYAIKYVDGSGTDTAKGTLGEFGTSTAISATKLTDSAQTEWDYNSEKGKYIEITDVTGTDILLVEENTLTEIIFSGNNRTTGSPTYKIFNNSKIYAKDYSTGAIQITSGAANIGLDVITNQSEQKLEINLFVTNSLDFIIAGDIITLNIPDEGINFQPFMIDEITHNLERKVLDITCSDEILYPFMEYDLQKLDAPVLTKWSRSYSLIHVEWGAVTSASYYRVYYGTNNKMFQSVVSTTLTCDITGLINWMGYYVYVTAWSIWGIESDRSEMIFLDKSTQSAGYIDGTNGYFYENYDDWGKIDKYFYLLTYKNVNYIDVAYLKKASLDILDKSQISGAGEVAATSTSQTLTRVLGYCDTAGVSTYYPFFFDDAGTYKIKNMMSQSLVIDGIVYDYDDIIADSENWFLTDANGDYFTYWFETGYMMDLTNTDYQEWFLKTQIDATMGIWESGTASGTGTLTDLSKTWLVNQWTGYYVRILSGSDVLWFKIISNTVNSFTISYTTVLTDVAYRFNMQQTDGFAGIFLDDVWDAMYQEGINKSGTDSGTGWCGATWVTDVTKSWEIDIHKGKQIDILGTKFAITDNTADTINFSGVNANVGNHAYTIKSKFEWDKSMTYAEAMADFIAIIRAGVESNSYKINGSYVMAAQGIICLNTWPEDFATNYPLFVEALNLNYYHFVMFEALQSTWNMANEVTKQFVVNDWKSAIDRYDQMKIVTVRLLTLGYPHSQQMLLSLIVGALMKSRYSSYIEDLVLGGNVILDQLFFDMAMAKNKNGNSIFGIADTGFEDTYTYPTYDYYGLCSRRFQNAILFYNPSRRIMFETYTFPDEVTSYYTGLVHAADTAKDIILLPRSADIWYRYKNEGITAGSFLQTYNPYIYIDANAAWIIFTTTGVAAIGTDSVWIVNGHGHHRRFVTDGSMGVPDGDASLLFHAGDGATTAVTGENAQTEVIVGTGMKTAVTLTSLTIWVVVRVYNNTDSAVLTLGIDYVIEHKDADATSTGKGKWETDIYFLTDQTGDNITVYYYQQGLDGSGYPDKDYVSPEFGILYRESSGFGLETGSVDYGTGLTPLVEGTDYYCVPELTRWKWDYRWKPFSAVDAIVDMNVTINMKDVLKSEDITIKRAIQHGQIDIDNCVLIQSDLSSFNSCNGDKADYDSMTITRPKILIYGFLCDPRDSSYQTIAVADRIYDKFRTESVLAMEIGILFDAVVITGDYDGIRQTENTGAWGSIQGWLDHMGYTVTQAQAYFNFVIIHDNFLEASAASSSGRAQWSSWIDEVDYNFLKDFTGIILDIRYGATAFTFWNKDLDGVLADRLIEDTLVDYSSFDDALIKYTRDLTSQFGILYYSYLTYSDLANASSEVYRLVNSTYEKIDFTFSTDLRIFCKINGITDTYDVDFENNKTVIYNEWEQGGDGFTYIPRTSEKREDYHYDRTKNYKFEKSRLYLKKKDVSDGGSDWLDYSDDDNFEQLGLDNIVLRREPSWIVHRESNFGWGDVVSWNIQTVGNRSTTTSCFELTYSGEFLAIPFLKSGQDCDPSFLIGKYFRYAEAIDEESDYKLTNDFKNNAAWSGYKGNYIADFQDYNNYEAQWLRYGNFHFVEEYADYWKAGWGVYDVSGLTSLGNVLEFDSWCDDVSAYYQASGMVTGPINYERFTPVYEGKIIKIEKAKIEGDEDDPNIRIATVNFDVSAVVTALPLNSGIVTELRYNNFWNGTAFDANLNISVLSNQLVGKKIIFNSIHSAIIFGNSSGKDGVWIALAFSNANLNFDFIANPYFEISNAGETSNLLMFNALDETNCLWDIPVLSVNTSLRTISFNASRVVARTGTEANPAAYIFIYQNQAEDSEIKNKDIMGGLVTDIDITSSYSVYGDPTGTMAEFGASKSDQIKSHRGLCPFENSTSTYIDSKIDEFAFEANTGLLTGLAYWKYGRMGKPNIIWGGVGVDDIKNLISNFIGTTLTFVNLNVAAGKTCYLYYNQITDMLQIRESDVGYALDMPYKKNTYYGDKLYRALAEQELADYFVLDYSELDGEDELA